MDVLCVMDIVVSTYYSSGVVVSSGTVVTASVLDH